MLLPNSMVELSSHFVLAPADFFEFGKRSTPVLDSLRQQKALFSFLFCPCSPAAKAQTKFISP